MSYEEENFDGDCPAWPGQKFKIYGLGKNYEPSAEVNRQIDRAVKPSFWERYAKRMERLKKEHPVFYRVLDRLGYS